MQKIISFGQLHSFYLDATPKNPFTLLGKYFWKLQNAVINLPQYYKILKMQLRKIFFGKKY